MVIWMELAELILDHTANCKLIPIGDILSTTGKKFILTGDIFAPTGDISPPTGDIFAPTGDIFP